MHLWDYKISTLKKSKTGQRLILENLINLGPDRRRIKKSLIKKHWRDLDIDPQKRKFLRFLIWGKV